REYKELPFKSRVLTYTELYDKVIEEMGEKAKKHMEIFEQKMLNDSSIDQRNFSLKMVEELHSLWSDKDPVVIVYFTPPYYPHIYVEGKNEKEKN
ncbi:MAG TPA: peptidase M20, partial [Terrisporobacter glycolicus]|nr:peptidase M20 [Terrisporobacter hibernicus]